MVKHPRISCPLTSWGPRILLAHCAADFYCNGQRNPRQKDAFPAKKVAKGCLTRAWSNTIVSPRRLLQPNSSVERHPTACNDLVIYANERLMQRRICVRAEKWHGLESHQFSITLCRCGLVMDARQPLREKRREPKGSQTS